MIAPPLRDYLWGVTHRKDALDGELWEKLRRQLIGRSDGDDATGDHPSAPSHDGRGIVLPPAARRDPRSKTPDPAAMLGTLLDDAAGVVRWEPINPNTEHRTCPSPGNRFTADLEIAVADARKVRRYRYLPHERMLAELPGPREPRSMDEGVLDIVLRGHVDRCARPYGDLALCLATIEIGAMLAQLVLALAGVQLGAEHVRFVGDGSAFDPVIHVRVRAPDVALWLARAPSVPFRSTSADRSPREATGGRLLHDLRTFVSSHAPEPDLFEASLTVSGCEPFLRASAMRSSGLDLRGGIDGRPDAAQSAALIRAVGLLCASFRGLDLLPVRLDARTDDPSAAAPWRALAGDAPAWLHVGPASAPAGSTGYACPDGAIVVTVSADLRDYAARTGAICLSAMHLAAGIATQIVCIAAAHAGLACRPMRSFDHAAADAALPIDYWSLIQLVVYADRAPNPAFATAGAPR